MIRYPVQSDLLAFIVGRQHTIEGYDCHIFADVLRWRGALISALVSIVFMPAILCVCEPLFHKTSYHWKTPDPAASLPSPAEALPAPEELPEEPEPVVEIVSVETESLQAGVK